MASSVLHSRYDGGHLSFLLLRLLGRRLSRVGRGFTRTLGNSTSYAALLDGTLNRFTLKYDLAESLPDAGAQLFKVNAPAGSNENLGSSTSFFLLIIFSREGAAHLLLHYGYRL